MKSAYVLILGVAFLLAGCGKDQTLNKQEDQRNQVGPELNGAWISKSPNQITRLNFSGDRLVFEVETHFNAENTDKNRTVKQEGSFKLASNFKEGVNNSIVFKADDQGFVTLHTDEDVKNQNTSLSNAKNEKEVVTVAGAPVEIQKLNARQNLRLAEVKKMTAWARGEAKSINRLQNEKLNVARFPHELSTRSSFRYEVDNGFLQIGGVVFERP